MTLNAAWRQNELFPSTSMYCFVAVTHPTSSKGSHSHPQGFQAGHRCDPPVHTHPPARPPTRPPTRVQISGAHSQGFQADHCSPGIRDRPPESLGCWLLVRLAVPLQFPAGGGGVVQAGSVRAHACIHMYLLLLLLLLPKGQTFQEALHWLTEALQGPGYIPQTKALVSCAVVHTLGC